MSTQATPPIPPEPASQPASGGVRRHHTISSSSRGVRASREPITEEAQEHWNDDEFVGEDWVGGVGAVGEKTSLHRQSSLPTKYHRAAFQNRGSKSGNITPKTMNSLTAIAGHEGDEDEWEREIGGYSAHDEEHQPNDPTSPQAPAYPANEPSPPPVASGVRRHVSLTYGAAGGARPRVNANLKRSGTLQTPLPPHPQTLQETAPQQSAEEEEYEYEYEEPAGYEDEYYVPPNGQYGATSPTHRPTWSSGSDWRGGGGPAGQQYPTNGSNNYGIDDVQRALSTLEIASNGQASNAAYTAGGQSAHPPRFNPQYPPPPQAQQVRNAGNNPRASEYEGRRTPSQQQAQAAWEQRERGPTPRTSNPNLQYGYQHGKSPSMSNPMPSVPPIPQQYLQQAQRPSQNAGPAMNSSQQAIDVASLIAAKGYNPVQFDVNPPFARFFVIKSYTEDDVHKSLKYEIWSSTDPGNKRLDKAFKESSQRGPIYLFFSVNGSGHFCGMAEMLTPVDYSRSSTVWAQDKWKGVFNVRWIFVRDIPNSTLRHIKLNNTQERKPVTNSRDTQELLSDAGLEMMRTFLTHPARTSLLQDFAYYEIQAMQKQQGSGASSPQANPLINPLNSPPLQSTSPVPQMAMGSPYTMPPMMQMQMMGMAGLTSPQLGFAQSQAMQQSVMRHPSPGPQPQGGNPSGPGFSNF